MPQEIEQIIETDKQARGIVEKARKVRDEILNDAKVEQRRALEDAETRLRDLKSGLRGENEKYINEVREKADKLLAEKTAALDEVYNKGEGAWCEDMVKRILED